MGLFAHWRPQNSAKLPWFTVSSLKYCGICNPRTWVQWGASVSPSPGLYGGRECVRASRLQPSFMQMSSFATTLLCDLEQAAAPLGCGFSICAERRGLPSPLVRGSANKERVPLWHSPSWKEPGRGDFSRLYRKPAERSSPSHRHLLMRNSIC